MTEMSDLCYLRKPRLWRSFVNFVLDLITFMPISLELRSKVYNFFISTFMKQL